MPDNANCASCVNVHEKHKTGLTSPCYGCSPRAGYPLYREAAARNISVPFEAPTASQQFRRLEETRNGLISMYPTLTEQAPAAGIGHNEGPPLEDPVEPQEDTTNPKDRLGALKASTLSVVPCSALLALGGVMSLGAKKYGPFNWREKSVRASVYTDAAMRHLMAWVDGEDIDLDPDPVTGEPRGSGESHLASVMACMSILIDAKARGCLVDDRNLPQGEQGTAGEIIRLRTQQGPHAAGSLHRVAETVPHGGNYDCSAQYRLQDNTYVPSDCAEVLPSPA